MESGCVGTGKGRGREGKDGPKDLDLDVGALAAGKLHVERDEAVGVVDAGGEKISNLSGVKAA